MFNEVKHITNHYYDDKEVEYGRIWVSIFRLDLGFFYVDFKYPTWKKWTKTKWYNKDTKVSKK